MTFSQATCTKLSLKCRHKFGISQLFLGQYLNDIINNILTINVWGYIFRERCSDFASASRTVSLTLRNQCSSNNRHPNSAFNLCSSNHRHPNTAFNLCSWNVGKYFSSFVKSDKIFSRCIAKCENSQSIQYICTKRSCWRLRMSA